MKKITPLFIALLVATFAATGCQNYYALTYRPTPASAANQLLVPTTEPRVISTDHLRDEAQVLQGAGYEVIGSSSFSTTDWKPEWARRAAAKEQGKAVGADLVLLTMETGGKLTTTAVVDTPSGPDQGPTTGPRTVTHTSDLMACKAVYLRKTATVQ